MKPWSFRLFSCRLICAIALLAISQTSRATTIVVPTDEQLIDKSPLVVVARVEASSPVQESGAIRTLTTLTVERTLKGHSPQSIVVRELGGQVGDRWSVIFGSPEYKAGERVLVFLWPTNQGDYQTRDLFIGKFVERQTIEGERIWFRPQELPGTSLLDKTLVPFTSPDVQRHADRFERFVAEHSAGRQPLAHYFVPKPHLRSDVSSDFTLIDEPNLYRWFAFDSGTVSWRHSGTQAGYTNGGVAELQTGMGSWTSYSSARIRYTYAGVLGSATGGLETVNGINEVIFEDPLNEIDGSWNGSSGVLGRGGFNSVRSARSWTSPFAADPSHPGQTFSSVWDIAEGNLVIQNGISPSRGISSAILAEVLAHEFGHTLGFGHSSDDTALMYASITGLGPSLRGDDQMGARWLYPTGASTPSLPPTAPSSLSGTGVGNSIQLNWIDNATNETLQTIYLAVPGGPFVSNRTVGADVTSSSISSLTAGQIYQVRLTASNGSGESATSNTIQVLVPGDVVRAAISVSPTSGIANVTNFAFTDRSTGPVMTRQWTFGDGTSSSERNPTHLFSAPGTYAVRLRVADSSGTVSDAQSTVLVTLTANAISAGFTYAPLSPTADQSITFADQSVGPVTQWLWTFGDGTTSTERNPAKRYVSGGIYEVSLTASNGASSSTATTTISVAGGSGATPLVSAEFDLSTLWPAAGGEVRFFDRSFGSPNSWLWNFGDGTTSTLRNPVHAYDSPGSYTVSLRAGNLTSNSTKTSVIAVTVAGSRYRSLLPVSTLTSGAGSTSWRTELTLANPTSVAVNVDTLFLSSTGETPLRRSVVIGAGQAVTYQNALTDLFGLLTGLGAITIDASSSTGAARLHVANRTFTSSPVGTYGQFVPASSVNPPATLFVTGIESSTNYRTNIGLVNHTNSAVSTNVAVYDSNGAQITSTPLSIPAGGFQQTSLASLFPAAFATPRSGLSIRFQSSVANALSAYASIVDNRSQDPVFVPAVSPPPVGDLIVAGVARIPGAAGTFWRTDMTLFNATLSSISLRLKLISGSQEKTVSLPSGSTMAITDVLDWLGEGNTQGTLLITEVQGLAGPIVSTRTYTTRDDGGTYGQWIPAVPVSELRESSFVAGLRADEAYRTNVGFSNAGDTNVVIRVRLLNAAAEVANTSLVLAPRSSSQTSIGALFPSVDIRLLGSFSVKSEAEGGGFFFSYGSVIDNASGDPIFVRGE